MKLLQFGLAEFQAGLDPDRIDDRDKLPVVKRGLTRKTVVGWLYERRAVEFPGYVVRPDGNPFGFMLVNREGDCLIPEA